MRKTIRKIKANKKTRKTRKRIQGGSEGKYNQQTLDEVCYFYRELEEVLRNHDDPLAELARKQRALYDSPMYRNKVSSSSNVESFEEVFPVIKDVANHINSGQLNLLLNFYNDAKTMNSYSSLGHRDQALKTIDIYRSVGEEINFNEDEVHPFIIRLKEKAIEKANESVEELEGKMNEYLHEATAIRHRYASDKIDIGRQRLDNKTFKIFKQYMYMKDEDPLSDLSKELREVENEYRLYYAALDAKRGYNRNIPFYAMDTDAISKNYNLMLGLPVIASPVLYLTGRNRNEINNRYVRAVNKFENRANVANAVIVNNGANEIPVNSSSNNGVNAIPIAEAAINVGMYTGKNANNVKKANISRKRLKAGPIANST